MNCILYIVYKFDVNAQTAIKRLSILFRVLDHSNYVDHSELLLVNCVNFLPEFL